MPLKTKPDQPGGWRLWGPFLFWLALIFAFSAYPKALIPQGKYISWDKLAHIAEFGVLGYLTARALRYSGLSWLSANFVWLSSAFGLGYGISDEWHQLYVRGRFASVYDVMADFIGVLLGIFLLKAFIRRRKNAA